MRVSFLSLFLPRPSVKESGMDEVIKQVKETGRI